jgi:transcriptional regulator with XRE-family HTH domain
VADGVVEFGTEDPLGRPDLRAGSRDTPRIEFGGPGGGFLARAGASIPVEPEGKAKFLERLFGEGLTQAELGRLMGQSSQQVARWEKGQSEIPGPADRLLRAIYLLNIMSEQERDEFMSLLEELDAMDAPPIDTPVMFRVSEAGWSENRVSASECACM